MCDKGEPRTGVRGCAICCAAGAGGGIHAGHPGTAAPGSPLGDPLQAVQSGMSPSTKWCVPVTPPQPHAARPFFLRVFASSREKKHAPAAPREAAKGTARGLLNVYPCRAPGHCRTRLAPGAVLCRRFKVLCPRQQSAVSPSTKWCVPVTLHSPSAARGSPVLPSRLRVFASSRLRVRKNTPLLLHAKPRREPHGDS